MKGQNIMDVMMLIMALVFLLFFIATSFGQSATQAQTMRYEAAGHQRGLLTVLNTYIELPAQKTRGRVIELLALAKCNLITNPDLWTQLKTEIQKILDELNGGKKNYIFATNFYSNPDLSRVYNYISDVCLKDIPIASFETTVHCPSGDESIQIQYGTWFEWEQVTVGAAC